MRFATGAIPVRKGYTQRPDLIHELAAMEMYDLLMWNGITPHQFHSAIKSQPLLTGMRFRTFEDRGTMFIVRVQP